MPCKLCRKCGHNSRTCPNKLSSIKNDLFSIPLPFDVVDIEKQKQKQKQNKHYCYILQQKQKTKSLNYVGYTVNYNRRLRQHCGIIKGGAIYTKNRGPWEFLAVMHCPTWDHIRGLQVEWLLKHPTRKTKRPKCFSGSLGRINSLIEVFHRIPNHEEIILYIHPSFFPIAMSSNIQLYKNVTLVPELSF